MQRILFLVSKSLYQKKILNVYYDLKNCMYGGIE